MRITDPELLKARARNLEDAGLNGLELLFVELTPPEAPVQAELYVQFHNELALADIAAAPDAFTLSGGTRIIGGSCELRHHDGRQNR